MTGPSNLERVRQIFKEESKRHGLRGVVGVASFRQVYEGLLPVQKRLLENVSGNQLLRLLESGSVISIAYAYSESAIEAIAVESKDGYEIERWNEYAKEYRALNRALDDTATRLALETDGIALPATVMDIASEINRVEDYYVTAISHRVAAEMSGIGWRGKNELIVNPEHGCAIRLTSVVTGLELERTPSAKRGCGDCRACLDACPILDAKERLENYREQCRRYIVSLGLESDVCGKCIKACINSRVFKTTMVLFSQPLPLEK